mgnify:CR=1 FL=1
MIGEFVAYAAGRATGGAVESASRRAAWFVAGGLVLLLGCTFALVAAFWTLEPLYGSIQSAGFIAAGCVVLALLCFVIPAMEQWVERRRSQQKAIASSPVAETINAVNVEATEAVDYFGPLKVVTTAFMVGMSAAKQFRGQREAAQGRE